MFYDSHLFKHCGFLDSFQVSKIWYLWALPYLGVMSTYKRFWSLWPLVLWVPFTFQICPVSDLVYFHAFGFIAHSITFRNQLVAYPLSKISYTYWCCDGTLVIVQCFECGILVAEWLPSASAMAAFWRQAKHWIGCGVVPWAPINCKWH
jgi:hypothetical protein